MMRLNIMKKQKPKKPIFDENFRFVIVRLLDNSEMNGYMWIGRASLLLKARLNLIYHINSLPDRKKLKLNDISSIELDDIKTIAYKKYSFWFMSTYIDINLIPDFVVNSFLRYIASLESIEQHFEYNDIESEFMLNLKSYEEHKVINDKLDEAIDVYGRIERMNKPKFSFWRCVNQ